MACRPSACWTWSSRSAASRWAKWWKANCVFRWLPRLPERFRRSESAIANILLLDALRRAIAALALGGRRTVDGAEDDSARMEQAANHRAVQRPRPRRGQLYRRAQRVVRRQGDVAARLSRRLGRAVREHAAGPEAIGDRHSRGAGADRRCCSTWLIGSAIDTLVVFASVPFACVGGIGGFGAPRHAAFDLRGSRFYHALGRFGAEQHGDRLRCSRPQSRQARRPSRSCFRRRPRGCAR